MSVIFATNCFFKCQCIIKAVHWGFSQILRQFHFKLVIKLTYFRYALDVHRRTTVLARAVVSGDGAVYFAVPWRPSNLENSRTGSICVRSMNGINMFGLFFTSPTRWETTHYTLK